MLRRLGSVEVPDSHSRPAQTSGHIAGGQLQLRAALALNALPVAIVKPASHGAVAFVERARHMLPESAPSDDVDVRGRFLPLLGTLVAPAPVVRY